MKRAVIIILVFLALLIVLWACIAHFVGNTGAIETTDLSEYNTIVSSSEVATFFPKSIDDYDVISFSYRRELDNYEAFLVIKAEQGEFEKILDEVRGKYFMVEEKESHFCEGYYEILISDLFKRWNDNREMEVYVDADIEKVIYNVDTGTIVFVDFNSEFYSWDDIAYFDWMGIDVTEYADRYD